MVLHQRTRLEAPPYQGARARARQKINCLRRDASTSALATNPLLLVDQHAPEAQSGNAPCCSIRRRACSHKNSLRGSASSTVLVGWFSWAEIVAAAAAASNNQQDASFTPLSLALFSAGRWQVKKKKVGEYTKCTFLSRKYVTFVAICDECVKLNGKRGVTRGALKRRAHQPRPPNLRRACANDEKRGLVIAFLKHSAPFGTHTQRDLPSSSSNKVSSSNYETVAGGKYRGRR